MEIELKVPAVGESITEVEIGQWLINEGEAARKDENVVVLESEKATVELPAPSAGTVSRILKKKGQTAAIGEVIGYLVEQEAPKATETKPDSAKVETPKPEAPKSAEKEARVMPAAARVLAEHGLKADDVPASGPGGRILKEDVLKRVETISKTPPPAPPSPAPSEASLDVISPQRLEQVVPISRLRKTLAERLVHVQQTAALLTTFNEVDMSGIMALRKEFQEAFVAKYNVKLGFMSFFVKAVVDGLKLVPEINAEIRGTDIIYRNYQDIGVAVGGGKGLVVPVLRNAERMSFSQIELAIAEFAKRARENKLKVEELQGGTFTISNGGVYGSLLSTPIINPPQSGILGMHGIVDRPVAREGAVVIRPMMYIALTYDHRVVDGREAVTFLKRVKDAIETPARMLLEI